jgi:hypothetical protein
MHNTTTEPRFDADAALGVDAEFVPDPALRGSTRNGTGRNSIVALLRSLTAEGRDLLSLEMALAKAEVRESLDVYKRNVVPLGIGVGLLFAALILAAWTANTALTALLDAFLPLGVAVWLAPLILTLVFGGIGLSKVRGALEKMSHESLVPRKTIETLKDDARWAERKVHS